MERRGLEEILALHADPIERYGGSAGVRDRMALSARRGCRIAGGMCLRPGHLRPIWCTRTEAQPSEYDYSQRDGPDMDVPRVRSL